MRLDMYIIFVSVGMALFAWGCLGWHYHAQARTQVGVLRARLRLFEDAPATFSFERLQKTVEHYGYSKADLVEVRPGRIILDATKKAPPDSMMRQLAHEIPACIDFTAVTK